MNNKARLLIVDDEPKNIHLLSNVFADDYHISVAISGEQALGLLDKPNDIELILLDVMMPQMDGHAVFAKLRENPATAHIPVVFVTARTDTDSEILGLKAGAVDYIHKPIHVGIARIRVQQQLELARQRTHLQQLLRERTLEQKRLNNIIEGTRSGTWEWEVASDRLFINHHFALMLGYGPQDLAFFTMAHWKSMLHPDDVALCTQTLADHLRDATQPHSMTVRVRHKEGHWVWVQSRGSRMMDDTSQAVRVFGTQTDITALVQARLADEANRAKTEFLSRMSHELRTPLNAILGFGQLMSMGGELSTVQADHLTEITNAGRHLLGLVNEVLDLSQIEAGRMRVHMQGVTLRPLVLKSTHLLEPLAKAGKVSLLIDITPDLVVHADPKRLEQVLVNLVSNAIKYNHEDGWVKVMARRDPNDQVRISVVDNGRGITTADQALIFKAFERGSAENTGVQGSGLGLSLTKKFLELMQGEIGFESTPKQGSTFWFTLGHGPSASAKHER